MPVAPLGVMFFALVLRPRRMAGSARRRGPRNAPGYIFALSTVALAFVLYLGWASYFVLKTFCILCAITYVSVIAIFIISGGATTFPMNTLPARALRDIRTLVSSPVALLMALLFAAGGRRASSPRSRARAARRPAAQRRRRRYPPLSDDERAKLAQWWDSAAEGRRCRSRTTAPRC